MIAVRLFSQVDENVFLAYLNGEKEGKEGERRGHSTLVWLRTAARSWSRT